MPPLSPLLAQLDDQHPPFPPGPSLQHSQLPFFLLWLFFVSGPRLASQTHTCLTLLDCLTAAAVKPLGEPGEGTDQCGGAGGRWAATWRDYWREENHALLVRPLFDQLLESDSSSQEGFRYSVGVPFYQYQTLVIIF